MPFQKIEPEKISSSITHQIEQLILRGVLHPGERLPSERELAARFEVSRPTLRDALADLEEQGLIVTRPGSGAFVAQVLGSAFAPALVALFSKHDEAFFDYLSFRRDLEGMAAERAAEFANETDIAVITSIFNRMEIAHKKRNPTEEAKLDAEFHSAIVEAAHNVVMLHMMRSMYELLRGGVFYNRQVMFKQKISRSALLDQHRAINNALQSRDPAAARAAVEAHLSYVAASLTDQQKADRNDQIARQRLEHESNT